MPIVGFTLLIAAIAGATLQIILLNIAMRYYNNLDIIPVYQSLILIMMLLCGWMLLNEIQFYEWIEITGLLGSSLLVIIGIKVITMKTNIVQTLKKKNQPANNLIQLDNIQSDAKIQDVNESDELQSDCTTGETQKQRIIEVF